VSSGALGAGAYLAGAFELAITLAGVAVTAGVIDRRRLAFLRGADRVVAVALVAIAALLADHLLPLMAGVMTRATVPAVSVLMAALALRYVPAEGGRRARPWTAFAGAARRAAIRAQGGWLRAAATRLRGASPAALASGLLGAAAVLAVASGSLAYTLATSRQPFTLVDIASFHLPNVARWIQSGSLWQVDQFIPYLWQGNYPQSGDVMLLAAVLPWHSDFAARYVDLPFVALTAAAVYAIARELGAPRTSALVFSACLPALPIVALSAYQGAMPDAVMYATFAGGSLFLLRFARTRRRAELVLAGLGLGICFGVKWYSLTSVAAVLIVWLAAELARRRGGRRLTRDAATVVGLIVALGGVWLLRNLLESGDPLFPTRTRLLGVTLFDAPPDLYRPVAGFRVLDYVGNGHVWSTYISPAFTVAFRRIGEVLLAGSALAAGLCLSRRVSRPERARVLAVLACGLLLTFAYFDTPYSALGPRGAPVNTFANTRYWVPALICAAPVCAWAAGRAGPVRLLVELAGALAVASGLRRGFTYPATADWLAGAVLAAAVAAAAAGALPRLAASPHRTRLRALAAAGVGLAAVGSFFLYFQQRAFLRGRYVRADPVLVALARDPARHRVALTGVWDAAGVPPVLPAFGPRLANRVDYVGPWVRHSLMQYEQPAPLAAALRRGRYDVVVLGTAAFPGRAATPPAWVAAAGFRVVGAEPRLVVFARR
jgi:hypothetical protein